MAIIIQSHLFSWNHIEARSDLDRFFLVRDNMPDENIVLALEKQRGNGRDDFPIRAMWNPSVSMKVRHLPLNKLV